jgi:hypothetical protein
MSRLVDQDPVQPLATYGAHPTAPHTHSPWAPAVELRTISNIRLRPKFSPPPVAPEPGTVDGTEILPRLVAILAGLGPDADLDVLTGAELKPVA